MKAMILKFWFVALLPLIVSARPARGDFTFGDPVNLGSPVNDSSDVRGMCVSRDGLALYFSSNRPGGYGGYDLWVATRPTTGGNWGQPVNLGPSVNTVHEITDPSLSSDGLSLYFADGPFGSFLPGGYGDMDLWVATRDTTSEPFGARVNLGPTLNNGGPNEWPCISADGLSLYCSGWYRGSLGLCDLWVSTRTSTSENWSAPQNLLTVSSPWGDGAPDISADGLALFFISTRPRDFTSFDDFELWMATRKTASEPFGTPVKLPPRVNTEPYSALHPHVSADGFTLYFCSNRPGGLGATDLWQTAVIPLVDFNGDGTVALEDLLRMIESWGQNDPAVDIGPMPWGDGVVDAKDLQVLMSHWGEAILDSALVAHWKLDETSGLTAADSVGTNQGTLLGQPARQPGSGRIDGALQLDGVDDYVQTPFVLNPAAGPFSVFAWVKGGAPGQVILAQSGGANWLRAASTTGQLQTELNEPGRNAGKSLSSAVVVTEGAWHRVGLVWDGSERVLYLDDVEVARGMQAKSPYSVDGLYLGVGSTLAPGTFWKGLIDDVRLYDRAVKP
jgi:Tol biopolymer transport system component